MPEDQNPASVANAVAVAYIYADGGSRGNPGPSGSGSVIKANNENGEILANLSKFVGITTNNVAEYTGLIMGLTKAAEMGIEAVEVRMDSELIVKQLKGIYRVKNEKLIPLFQQAVKLSRQFKRFNVEHVRREYNKEADRLANEAMDRGE